MLKILIRNQQKEKVALKALRGMAREMLRGLGCHEENTELSLLLTDNEGIRALNRRYLDRDRPTDVLSFPMWDFNSELRTPNSELILGDVVISIEKARKQAEELGVTMDEELSRLLVHGILHLFGFDHEKSSKEAQRMKKEEERLLKITKCKL
ncbi:MAG: rRNA maturation RNase YbeY [Deltaproteobacteria bacterium RIFCSPLOWO2_02_44_9]|nr:MAG: rRNA maturation RNase YbeY [Deltaproteobacteria bacterium RIFCSPLOWO2_02_44_9]